MQQRERGFSGWYLRLGAGSLVAALGLAALGYVPTVRLAGPEAAGAMVAGIAASLAAGLVGAVPLARAAGSTAERLPLAVMTATALRFLVVAALAASVILSGWFDRVVVAVWIGVSYMAMLFVDALIALSIVHAVRGQQT